jgi:hypothetical protein
MQLGLAGNPEDKGGRELEDYSALNHQKSL